MLISPFYTEEAEKSKNVSFYLFFNKIVEYIGKYLHIELEMEIHRVNYKIKNMLNKST